MPTHRHCYGGRYGKENNMREGQIQSQIIEYLMFLENKNELMFWRENNTPIYDPRKKIFHRMKVGQKKGLPDIIVLKKGILIGLEIKNDEKYKRGEKKGKYKNYLSPDQKKIKEMFEKNFAEYHCIRSFDEVVKVLEKER